MNARVAHRQSTATPSRRKQGQYLPRAPFLAALVLACALTLGGCAEGLLTAGGIAGCGIMPMSFDRCRPAKPHDDVGYKAALYYLACPKLGEWDALGKWPEDCGPLKARLGVQ